MQHRFARVMALFMLGNSGIPDALAQVTDPNIPPSDEPVNYINPVIPNAGDVVIAFGTTTHLQNPTDHFHVENARLELDHLSLDALRARYPTQFGNQAQVTFTTTDNNILGVVVWGDYTRRAQPDGSQLNSFQVAVPCLSSGPFTDASGNVFTSDGFGLGFDDLYGISFSGQGYDQTYNAYRTFLSGGQNTGSYTGTKQFNAAQFRQGVYSCSVQKADRNPLVGNPTSLQSQIVNEGMDLGGDSAAEQAPTTTTDGNATSGGDDTDWGVGFRVGQVNYGGTAGYQIDGRVNRSFRVLAGNRSLLTVDMPISYQRVAGQEQFRIFGAVSLVVPVTRRWTLEPRLAYGYSSAPQQDLKGQVASASLASRLFFNNPFGRGQLVVGNMVGYSKVTNVQFAGQSVDEKTENWNTRNGIAYELPLKDRMGGRQVSVRASYAYTRYFGDELFSKYLHEATVSMGVRLRGDSMRTRSESMRFGFLYKWGRAYKAGFAYVGYRF